LKPWAVWFAALQADAADPALLQTAAAEAELASIDPAAPDLESAV
jgi:hypothetical protein